MIYKDFKGLKLSNLGFGTMRFPRLNSEDQNIDVEKTAEMFDYALKNGVNYFDTAYGYHKGNSEIVTGNILSKYPRDSFYLATKFPGYSHDNFLKYEQIFNEQLKKLKVDYFDFYLFHCVSSDNIDDYMNNDFKLLEFVVEMKKQGKIKHIGFSCHMDVDLMKRFMTKYGPYVEFCQIQLNWFDWYYQDAESKVKYLNELNLPIWVMEPLRGGKLVNLEKSEFAEAINVVPGMSPQEVAFKFVQQIKGVTMILSGMSTLEQMKNNIEIFSSDDPLSLQSTEKIKGIAKNIINPQIIPCSKCLYCLPKCPKHLNIPFLLDIYKNRKQNFEEQMVFEELDSISKEEWPTSCIGCRSCEKVCTQNIKISEIMAKFKSLI